MAGIASTPKPPYYAVIFTSTRSDGDHGYEAMAERMVQLAARQAGFLGMESVRVELGVTVSYWVSLESIRAWHGDIEHQFAQKMGYQQWYKNFKVRVCKVERDYEFHRSVEDISTYPQSGDLAF
jgi:heme-degrading monooxygenase HmoA